MNYPTTGAQIGSGNAPNRPQIDPPKQSELDLVLSRASAHLEAQQMLASRIESLADRLLGAIPEKDGAAGVATDPGSTLGRIESVQSMSQGQMQRLHLAVQRLERL